MANTPAENFLAHHGVLGMHWGQRQANTGVKKLNRSEKKAHLGKYYQDKAEHLFNHAKKNPKSIMALKLHNDPYTNLVTGKQFADHLIGGGVFDVSKSHVYATQTKPNGPYALSDPYPAYKKP